MSKGKRIREQRRAVPPPVRRKGAHAAAPRWVWAVGALVAAALVASIAAYFATRSSSGSGGTPSVISGRLSHETLDQAGGYWPADPDNLPAVMAALKLPIADPAVLHHHDHLDIYVNGKKTVVPANIGLSQEAEVPLHTHDTSGIMHVESSSQTLKPTLGEFFDGWGLYLSRACIGGDCANGAKRLWVFVDGKAYDGDPTQIPLSQHEEIVIGYGTRAQLPRPIPKSYRFPQGL